MAVFKGGRWRSARTGRWVKRVTVARQRKVPRSAVDLGEKKPQKATVEVSAVSRIRLKDRYIETLHRRVLVRPTQKKLRQVREQLRRSAVKDTKAHMGGKELKKYGRKVAARTEVRRRITTAAPEHKTEVRDIGVLPEDWDEEKQQEYQEWWDDLDADEKRNMRKYLPVEVLSWLDEQGKEPTPGVWLDVNGRKHDMKTGRFV